MRKDHGLSRWQLGNCSFFPGSQGQVYLLVWAGGEHSLNEGVKKVGTHLLLLVFGLPEVDKGDPSMGDRGKSSTPTRLCQQGAREGWTAWPRPTVCKTASSQWAAPHEAHRGASWAVLGVAFRAAPLRSPAQDLGLQTHSAERGPLLLTLLHPSCEKGSFPLCLTLSAPSSFSVPFGHSGLG